MVEVPAGHVWVEGDGGARSLDSNTYGPISKSLIVGRIVLAIWPWSIFGRIRWEDYRGKTKVVKRHD
jgi:inner membrane protease subunit 2